MARRPAAGERAYTRRFTVPGPGFHVEFSETVEEQPPYPTATRGEVRDPSPCASSCTGAQEEKAFAARGGKVDAQKPASSTGGTAERVRARGRSAHVTSRTTPPEAAPPPLSEAERFFVAEPSFPQTNVKYGSRRFYVVSEATSCRHLEGIWLCQ